jgi:hypothetical protein
MTTATPTDWLSDNQRRLMAALGRVRLALERHIAQQRNEATPNAPADAASNPIVEPAPNDAAVVPPPTTLETLREAFGLSPFEGDLLVLCAGPELDGKFGSLIAAAHGDPRRTSPTFGLALAALPDAHWSALAPNAPLRHWRLIELGKDDALVNAPLTLDERTLFYLTGVNDLDERLQGLVQYAPAPAELPPSQLAIARRITEVWGGSAPSAPWPIVELCGAEGADKLAIAATACAELGLRLQTLRTTDIPVVPSERQRAGGRIRGHRRRRAIPGSDSFSAIAPQHGPSEPP